jgi:sortase (surface protein transpeptidase)
MLLSVGFVLLGLAGAFYAYIYIESRDSGSLVITADPDRADNLSAADPATPRAVGRPSPPWQKLYPGSEIPARQWADPRGPLDLGLASLDGFTPVSELGRPSLVGSIGRAERIAIPMLGIDVVIEELAIEDLGSSSAYETPKNIVGHIPQTPNPGSHGNGWYFGHLESPLQGEGDVFARLPKVPELLSDGEAVHVILESGGREYLYVVSETDLIHQSDMALYQAGDARVTLVTCLPRLRYDQRLLVTALLIGFRDIVPT